MSKYLRKINDVTDTQGLNTVEVDVYEVLEAFNVTCPARQHAIKKILCSGIRGKGDSIQDLTEAGASINRAIELETRRLANEQLEHDKLEARTLGGVIPAAVGRSGFAVGTENDHTADTRQYLKGASAIRGGQPKSAATRKRTRG